MTHIDKRDLRPVKVICNTELEVRAVKDFLEEKNMANTKPFVHSEDNMKDFKPNSKYNYIVADFGNEDFMIEVLERFKELSLNIKIIDLR